MNEIIQNRIETLRKSLKKRGLDAYIVPSTDPHMSEYVAPRWKSREWLSGFTGSAGTLVVTANRAGLWTDSRYFLQAEAQLSGTGIALYREMLPQTPSIPTFLRQELPAGSRVGVDGRVYATAAAEGLKAELEQGGMAFSFDFDALSEVWTDRPDIPQAPAYVYPLQYAGETAAEKLAKIRAGLEAEHCESVLLSALDEIAWTLNLRGEDVKCNPVVICYLLITQTKAILFIAPEKLTEAVAIYLKEQGVTTRHYKDVEDVLSGLAAGSVLLNPAQTNYSVFKAMGAGVRVVRGSSPVALLKAIRNKQEIEGLRRAMKKDGTALVRFLKWLEEAVPAGRETELSVDQKLHSFRAEQDLYMGQSFDTIAGYKEHGAIVHYAATPESSSTLQPKGFLLLDSGAQYLDGTTDITRTIALGELTEEEKTDYTLVLKGHIGLAMAQFPAGTRGAQLDAFARMPLWKHGMNFLHGTGHGVGHFLNVHEGPQSIRMNENPVVLQPGMLTSNEPGVYKAGSHGVRTENLILTVEAKEGMYGHYLAFETVTLCPICTKGIIKELLTAEETDWLNAYHQQVYDLLSDTLNAEERAWLKVRTQKL